MKKRLYPRRVEKAGPQTKKLAVAPWEKNLVP